MKNPNKFHKSTLSKPRSVFGRNSRSEEGYKELYYALLDNVPFSLVLLDQALRVVSVNRNFLLKGRRNEANTVGFSLHEVFPDVIMDFTQLESKIRHVFSSGLLLPGAQITYRAPGIHARIYYYTLIPVSPQEGVEYVMLVMDDITEKVQLGEKARMIERHLATVVESANDLVISTDIEGRVVSWNQAAERVSGYSMNEVLGQMLSELCQPTQRDTMKMIIRRLTRGRSAQSFEISLLALSGQLVPVDWSCSPIFDDASKVSGMVAVGRDLTERRAFEQRLIQSEKLAALGVMAGGIAHELRNPLAVSFSAAQFLLEPSADVGFQQECISKIIEGIKRSSLIIENLLRFARPTSDDQMTTVNLVEMAQETVNILNPQIKLKNIQITESYGSIAMTVLGNRSLLQQVLMNLILNACQAMPDGGEVTLTVWRKAGDILLQVADIGCGISLTNLNRVFDPFFTTQPVGKGTGLGLSISHTIVKQHKGGIELDSAEGKGSTFTVHLPYLKV